jgi:hypothetical protein
MKSDTATLVAIVQLFTIAIGILALASVIVGSVTFLKAPETAANVVQALIKSGSLIRMATALVNVAAIFGLRLQDLITGDAAIAALSGIAGYVLGSEKRTTPA